jgi:predicted ATPase
MRAAKRPSGESGSYLASSAILKSVALRLDRVPSFDAYPFSIPAVRKLGTLPLHPKVTFLVGENGSGKSTLIEAIAIAAGFNPEGGTKHFHFATRPSESALYQALQVVRGVRREKDGFFLRAESLFNVGTVIDQYEEEQGGLLKYYGGRSLHEQSHGESFIALVSHRFAGDGLYILDEPEAALSPSRQLAMLKLIHGLVNEEASQFIIATHSPILMAYPEATIYHLSPDGILPVAYEETEHFQITSSFLAHRESYLRHLFADL